MVDTFQNNKEYLLGLFRTIENNKPKEIPDVRGKRVLRQLYYEKGFYAVPDILKYQFTKDFNLKISDKCCLEMKEKPMLNYSRDTGRKVSINGLMREEGGRRTSTKCTIFDSKENLTSFNPLSIISKHWEDEFIQRYNIKLCKLYYPPFNLKRTGCKGCPYSLILYNDLNMMHKYLPSEYKQTVFQWKPVYDEYIRIGYRLKHYPSSKKNLF